MSALLTTRIPIRDQSGRVVDEKEVATYAGLLARAHEEGLRSIATELVQAPTEDNGKVAIVKATVETSKGTFTGIGDAAPDNVNRKIAAHLLRMAETRAKARALRDAVNIGMVALEELGDTNGHTGEGLEHEPSPVAANVRPLPTRAATPSAVRAKPEPVYVQDETAPSPSPSVATALDGRSPKMTESQRRYLFRLLVARGYEGEEAKLVLCEEAGVSQVAEITKLRASVLIDQWKNQNGQGASHAS